MTTSAMTTFTTYEQDKAAITTHSCPVCGKTSTGQVDQRRALQEHIKRSAATCIAHRAWREEWYSKHFIKGGDRQKQNVNAERIKDMIRKAYGEEWSNRVSIVG
jgi:hypothetical protein